MAKTVKSRATALAGLPASAEKSVFVLEEVHPLGDSRTSAVKSDSVSLEILTGLKITSFAMPRGKEKSVAKALKAQGIVLPASPKTFSSLDKKTQVIQTQPDQWFFIGTKAAKNLPKKVLNLGYCSEQSHGWVGVELAGTDSVKVLERLCPLNLSSKTFPNQSAARTLMDHIGVLILRQDKQRFWLLAPASSAQSFLHGLQVAIHNVS